MNKKIQHCPFCGEESYHHQTKLITLRYKSEPIIIKQPGYWCNTCGEGVIGGDDRKATQKELQTLRAEIDKLLLFDNTKQICDKLNSTQKTGF